MSGPVTPYEETRILPGVPPMPEGETLILPGAAPASLPEATENRSVRAGRRRWPAIAAAVVLILGGLAWWFARSAPAPGARLASAPRASALPPYLQTCRQAAEHGDAKAMRMLGASYTYGLGVRADQAEGAAWYRKAAEAGDRTAQQELRAVAAR